MKTLIGMMASLLGLFLPFLHAQYIPSSGSGYPSIEAEIDQLVRDYMGRQAPGMTVAVSKKGKMVFNKGYGYASLNNRIPMQPYHRTRIGSVSKVITALGMMKLTEENPGFTLDDKVYTENGVLAEPEFYKAIARCVKRYRPIIAMAVGPDYKVYTWYADGNVYVGNPGDLDADGQGQRFSLPPGKTIHDIRAIAISPNSNRVFTWYDDGSLSCGNRTDLDRYFYEAQPYTEPNGNKAAFRLPEDRIRSQIVGIAMGKNGSQTRTYTWYDNGTVSVGDARDLRKYAEPIPYEEGPGVSRYDIRGIGMGPNNHVFTWFSNNLVTEGSYTRLSLDKRASAYRLPPEPMTGVLEQTAWRVKTEVRHLLSHTSGIIGSGTSSAKSMFGLGTDDRVSELQVQLYVLSTQKLQWEPGTRDEYANRNIGFCAWIIQKVARKPYGTYIDREIFEPLGLSGAIVPYDHPKDAYDSDFFVKNDNGDLVTGTWETDPTGYFRVTAAGGWASSAASLIRIMAATDQLSNHSDILQPATLDVMEQKPFSVGTYAIGWGRTDRNRGFKLEHNGSIDGGRAYITKYMNGFRSDTNHDMSDINVAICANTDAIDDIGMKDLASAIAKIVAHHNIPAQYDLLSRPGDYRLNRN